jgi:hypothetical protein
MQGVAPVAAERLAVSIGKRRWIDGILDRIGAERRISDPNNFKIELRLVARF